MSTPAHTPTPWHVSTFDSLTITRDRPLGGSEMVAKATRKETLEQSEANAAFIVRACNSHAGLVAALDWAITYIALLPYSQSPTKKHQGDEYAQARAALAAAKE